MQNTAVQAAIDVYWLYENMRDSQEHLESSMRESEYGELGVYT